MSRILLVDDEKDIRATLSRFLRAAEHTVETAENAEAAIRCLRGADFDVVVLDIILPGVSGIELLRQIRAIAPQVQIIMITGEPTVENVAASLRAGAFDYLVKPIDKQDLLKSVANAARVKEIEDRRQQLEEENERYRQRLENLVKKRTCALRQSEAKYQRLIEHLQEGICVLDQQGAVTFANPCLAMMLGCPQDSLVGADFTTFLCKEQRPVLRSCIERWREGPFDGQELVLLRPDGARIHARVTVTPLQDDAPEYPGIVAAVTDVTAERVAQAKLRLMALAAEKSADSIVVTDAEGIIQYVNPAFERLTGYSREEAIGQTPRLVKSGVHNAAFYEELWRTIKSGVVWSGHFINMRKDGTLFEEDATISPVLDGAGRVTHFVGVKHDVTEKVQAEHRLRQAQKMEAIGVLAGGIAHDFNNVLAAIMGYSEMAADELPKGSPLGTDLDQVLTAATRAKELVRQILTFCRQTDAERCPVAVHLVIAETMKLLRPSLPANIEIRQKIDKQSGAVMADPTQIHQIIMNLCTNAYHAMRGRGGVLEVALAPVEIDAARAKTLPNVQCGPYIQLTVSDTGHGMDTATLDRIFEPFFTTKERHEGTGMGLAIVHGIVQDLGGAITVESQPNCGSVFTIYLPRMTAPSLETAQGSEAPLPGGKESILVIDDEATVAAVICKALMQLGYQVTTKTDSREALDTFLARPHVFDLILVDYIMPKLTGTDIAAEVARVRPDLPVVLSTGSIESMSAERAAALGFHGFLAKPASIRTIANTVRNALDEAWRNRNATGVRSSQMKRTG